MELKPGDIIKVDRGPYYHFGIYSGNNKVIHYTADEGLELSKYKAKIDETSLKKFMNGDTRLLKVNFPKKYGRTITEEVEVFSEICSLGINGIIAPQNRWLKKMLKNSRENKRKKDYKIYSKEETLERAKSKIGDSGYSIPFNNCEHFVWWCKTGIKKSEQIDDIEDFFDTIEEIIGKLVVH